MKNDGQFEQLVLQYKQLKNGSEEIRKLIELEDFDAAITMIKNREPLFLNCKCMRRFLELTPEQEIQLNEVLDDLKSYENESMQLLKKNMDNVRMELQKTQKTERIQQAYEQDEKQKVIS